MGELVEETGVVERIEERPAGRRFWIGARRVLEDTRREVASQRDILLSTRATAGLEPMNAALATTATASLGPVSAAAQRSLPLLSYSEIRDARVAFFVDEMPAGEYEYAYLARATTPGTFRRPAGSAEAMYRPEVVGTTAIDEVTVQ